MPLLGSRLRHECAPRPDLDRVEDRGHLPTSSLQDRRIRELGSLSSFPPAQESLSDSTQRRSSLHARSQPIPVRLEPEVYMALTQEDVISALKECYDPEIPVNIVDLGLIYEVRVKPTAVANTAGEDVEVEMTLTAQGCPSSGQITDDVKRRLLSVPGVTNASVEIVWYPQWTPERLSADARKQLGIE